MIITLHNAEEALWMPQWFRHVGRFVKPVGRDEFRFAVIVITMIAYLTTALFLFFPEDAVLKYAFAGFAGAMILNAFLHLGGTVLVKKYSPGTITGLFLIVPVYSLILADMRGQGLIGLPELAAAIVIVGVLLLGSIPCLEKLGTILINFA